MMMSGLAVVLHAQADIAESPVWYEPIERLLWVDIRRREIHMFDPGAGRDRVMTLGEMVGCVVPRASGGVVAATERGFVGVDLDTGTCDVLAEVEADLANNRMNDGKCDPQGRLWAGTMAKDSTGTAGTLYRLEIDHRVTTTLSGVAVSNGLGWSPDSRSMYFADSPTQRVDVFDFDSGSGRLSGRRPLIQFGPTEGNPDGMAVDVDGNLWVAMWDGWTVRQYTPRGDLIQVVDLPVSKVTSCAFGGPDYGTLYITTASKDLSALELQREPLAGDLFKLEPGVRGTPPSAYLG
jgi:sugar lactone lactonase YvrE